MENYSPILKIMFFHTEIEGLTIFSSQKFTYIIKRIELTARQKSTITITAFQQQAKQISIKEKENFII